MAEKQLIPLFKVFIPPDVDGPLLETLHSGYVGEGPKVAAFEKAVGERMDNPHVLALNSGTSAIQLALRLAGVKPGDTVISSPMTCSATNSPILHAGAYIAWGDIDPLTGNLDAEDVARLPARNTARAVMCVDWGGYPCETLHYRHCAQGASIIEDAAHALGAALHGNPVGSRYGADFTCFSLQAIKTITTIDGGLLACQQGADWNRGRKLRWFGIDRNVAPQDGDLRCGADISEPGYKMHMNDVTASIGLVQLTHLNEQVARQRANAKAYDEAFADDKRFILMRRQKGYESSCWLYTIRLAQDRDGFMARMKDAGIMTSKVHARNDKYSMFAAFERRLPGVDEFYASHICIPVGWWVTDEDRARIIEAARKAAV